MDQAFADAAALGVTVTAAAGDNGSSDGATDGKDARRLPRLQPARARLRRHAAAGRRAPDRHERDRLEQRRRQRRHRRRRQRRVRRCPAWQASPSACRRPAAGAGRGRARRRRPTPTRRPATRCSSTAQDMVIGGTSAVAPLWAALGRPAGPGDRPPARAAQPTLYAGRGLRQRGRLPRHHQRQQRRLLRAAGWDACTGLGSPTAPRCCSVWAALRTVTWERVPTMWRAPTTPAR